MGKRLVTIVIRLSFFSTPLLAQSPPGSRAMSAPPATQQSQAASSPAQSLGMFAFPKKQQTISLMRAEAPRCAVVCGISCIRPRAPFNDTAFPVPYDGGLFECLRSGPVTPYPPGARMQPAYYIGLDVHQLTRTYHGRPGLSAYR